MFRRVVLFLLIAVSVAAQADAQNRTHRRRGALLGGLAGAAIGVAIGDKGDNETAGALIGGAVGAIAGGTIGNARDQRIEHYQHYHGGYPVQTPSSGYRAYSSGPQYRSGYRHPDPVYNQSYFQPRVYSSSRYAEPTLAPEYSSSGTLSAPEFTGSSSSLSSADVVAMSRSGMSEVMVISQIQRRGFPHALSVADIISLHEQGVSERVIDAMQAAFDQSPAIEEERVSRPVDGWQTLPEPASSSDSRYGPTILAPANSGV